MGREGGGGATTDHHLLPSPPPGHPTTSGVAQPRGPLKRRRYPSHLMSRNGGNGAHPTSHGQGRGPSLRGPVTKELRQLR